ncbi:MAG: carboxypeptidase-like regulatory domain-containing protein [Pseudomonadota bacterium]
MPKIGIMGLLGLLIACAPMPPSSTAAESGVEGHVTMGPTCGAVPVGRRDNCRNKPMQTQLEVRDSKDKTIASAHSDPQGYYRIVLPPGSYILQPREHGFLSVQAIPFKVNEKGFVHINVQYMTGIR